MALVLAACGGGEVGKESVHAVSAIESMSGTLPLAVQSEMAITDASSPSFVTSEDEVIGYMNVACPQRVQQCSLAAYFDVIGINDGSIWIKVNGKTAVKYFFDAPHEVFAFEGFKMIGGQVSRVQFYGTVARGTLLFRKFIAVMDGRLVELEVSPECSIANGTNCKG